MRGLEPGAILSAAGALVATRVGLRVAGFSAWKRKLEKRAQTAKSYPRAMENAALAEAQRIARAAGVAARHLFFQPTCLELSLALCSMLLRRGIAAELRMGARKHGGHFEAHAWLELHGTVLNDARGEHLDFLPFEGPISTLRTQGS